MKRRIQTGIGYIAGAFGKNSRFKFIFVGSVPYISILFCALMPFLLQDKYEEQYASQWHQSLNEIAVVWEDFNLDLLGSPLASFGFNPNHSNLWPTFLFSRFFDPDIRIPAQAAFQCVIMLLLSSSILRLTGYDKPEAYVIGVISMGYCWNPYFSSGAITELAVSGLLVQDVLIVVLASVYLYFKIGRGIYSSIFSSSVILFLIVWLLLAMPGPFPVFAIAISFLWFGSLLAVESKREFLWKLLVPLFLLGILLFSGFDDYITNIHRYTVQMFYRTLDADYFAPLAYKNETLLMAAYSSKNIYVLLFFGLAISGVVASFCNNNSYARYLAISGLAFEVLVHAAAGINIHFKIVPMTFLYVELIAIPVITLLAGIGIFNIFRMSTFFLGAIFDRRKIILAELKCNSTINKKTAHRSHAFSSRHEALLDTSPYLLAVIVIAVFFDLYSKSAHRSNWPPDASSVPAKIQIKSVSLKPGEIFRGRSLTLLHMGAEGGNNWDVFFFPILVSKYRQTLGYEFTNDAKSMGVPVSNEFGHWISPPMLALLATSFYDAKDYIGRATQAPRVYRPNLARLMGISLVVADKPIHGEQIVYEGYVSGHPLYIHSIADTNLGQYSPVKSVVARNAEQVLNYLQANNFDGKDVVILESPFEQPLVRAENVVVSVHKGPKIHIEAFSSGTSILILPFDFSHCLHAAGSGLINIVPVNLSQTGLIFSGGASIDIDYRYGLVSGTFCRKLDLERAKTMDLENAATGRLFNDSRPKKQTNNS